MRHRRYEVDKREDSENGEHSSTDRKLLSTRPKPTKRSRLLTATMLFFLAATVTLCSLYHWINRNRLNLDVFFSCRQMHDAPYTSPCVYFHPTKYFFQAGHVYNHIIDATQHSFQWSMWAKQVSTFYSAHSRLGASPPSKLFQAQGIESVSAILMPKVASRSMEVLFQERLSVGLEDRMIMKIKGPRIGTATPAFWKQVAQRQVDENGGHFSQHKNRDIVIALVRDPLSRFLSSLAQTLSTTMMRKHKPCVDFWTPCLDSSKNYKDLVKCAIQRMHETPYFDVHVLPQAAFLANTLGGHDVQVAVFQVKDLGTILQAFQMNKEQHVNTRQEKEYTSDVMEKFGEELQNPGKARQALDESMISDICGLYEMDVCMMHDLGFLAGDCDNVR